MASSTYKMKREPFAVPRPSLTTEGPEGPRVTPEALTLPEQPTMMSEKDEQAVRELADDAIRAAIAQINEL